MNATLACLNDLCKKPMEITLPQSEIINSKYLTGVIWPALFAICKACQQIHRISIANCQMTLNLQLIKMDEQKKDEPRIIIPNKVM